MDDDDNPWVAAPDLGLEERMLREMARRGLGGLAKTRGQSPPDYPEAKAPGQLVQYAKYENGYTPATTTVEVLPAGVYKIDMMNGNLVYIPQPVVTDNLVRLSDSKSELVISEIESFWTKREAFKAHGFSHRRGFLLFGPPGSGKTCTVMFVMGQLIKSGGVVFLGSSPPHLVAKALRDFREIEPDRGLVLVLEDLDAMIQAFGEADMLSILDGESSVEHVVTVATTNYPENLDGRVVNRPSRFDRVVRIGMPNKASRKQYLESRDLSLTEGELEKWVELTDGLSIAHIKEIIIGVFCFDTTFDDVLARMKSMGRKKPQSDPEFGGNGPTGFMRGVQLRPDIG